MSPNLSDVTNAHMLPSPNSIHGQALTCLRGIGSDQTRDFAWSQSIVQLHADAMRA